MKVQIVCGKYIVITVPVVDVIGADEIKDAVHKILRQHSLPLWERMKVEIYCNGEECLYFIFPEQSEKIYIASYAIPYLDEYFTE